MKKYSEMTREELLFEKEAVEKRYSERYPRYCSSADKILKTDGIAEHAAEDIGKDFI